MAFRRKARKAPPRTVMGWTAAACHGTLWLGTRLVLSASVVTILAIGVLYLRLLQGPILLPGLGQMAVDAINAETGGTKVTARTMVFDLGDHRTPTGLEFRDVGISTPDGQALFAAPRLRAGFSFTDLVRGKVRLQRLSLIEADVQLTLAKDGRLRLGLNDAGGMLVEAGSTQSDPGSESWAAVLDQLSGDQTSLPQLQALEKIEILSANISYQDRQNGGAWQADSADLTLRRDSSGLSAVLEIDEFSDDTAGLMRVVATRRHGTGIIDYRGQFGQFSPAALAKALPALAPMAAVDAMVEGRFSGRLEADGNLSPVEATLLAEDGKALVAGQTRPFDMALLRMRIDHQAGELSLDEGLLVAQGLEARIGGLAQLQLSTDNAVEGMRGQIDIGQLYVDPEDALPALVKIDGGQLTASWRASDGMISLVDSWLTGEAGHLNLSGRLIPLPDGRMRTDLRADAQGMTIDGLLALWPVDLAANARVWTADNIKEANIERFLTQVSDGPDGTSLSIDLNFSGMQASYVQGMSPLQDGRGNVWLDDERMVLTMDSADVSAGRGRTVSLSDSQVLIRGFSDPVTEAEVALSGAGSVPAVLSLIDQEPLRLVRNLGLDVSRIDGKADVRAALRFPLIAALRVDDVDVSADAVLSDVAMPLDLGAGGAVKVASDRLEIEADVNRLRLTGPARVNGAAVEVEWLEDYASRPGKRNFQLAGTATPEVLEAFGAEAGLFEGKAGIKLTLAQQGSTPPEFDLTVNLRNAAVSIDALDWQKPAGDRGRLNVTGTAGKSLSLERLELDTETLSASGVIELDDDGGLQTATMDRVRIPGTLDAAVSLAHGNDGVQEIVLTGRLLDLSNREDGGSDGNASPFRVRLDLDQVRLTEKIAVRGARGSIERAAGGALDGKLTGRLGPAPVDLQVQISADGNGTFVLNSSDAGAALSAADVYRGARGGTLSVTADIEGGEGGGLTGMARIEDVTVRSQATFRDVLEDGGLGDAGESVANDGIGFRKIWVPFHYQGGIVEITDALAVSTALGLKMTGTLDETTEQLDLAGVLSPAYGLTGALNDIPLIGDILGGEGEGVFGMTFTLKGAMRDPNLSVNPLSLLTPGILRKIFSGERSGAEAQALDDRFRRNEQ